AVGRCLGEIGPINFSTTALQHSKTVPCSSTVNLFEDRELQWVFIMVTLINNALIDHIEIRSAAAACLKNILATETGHAFWEICKSKEDTMLVYLHPFRLPKKKVPEKARETPSEDLDNANLWIPQSESHEDWIKNLTCALLDSGEVKCEVLLLLKPLCKVQTDFCQTILPYLIHDILLHDSNESRQALLSTHIQMFFTTCCKYALTPSRSSTPANSDPGNSDDLGYKKIARTLKLSCSMVAKTIQRFNRTGSTENRPRHGRPKKLSAHAQRHIQRLALGNRHMSAASIAAEVEGVVGQPVSAQTIHCIKLVCRAVIPEGSLF
ncbi:Serine-protein kinase ATM, partial [Varanus komodoensis]